MYFTEMSISRLGRGPFTKYVHRMRVCMDKNEFIKDIQSFVLGSFPLSSIVYSDQLAAISSCYASGWATADLSLFFWVTAHSPKSLLASLTLFKDGEIIDRVSGTHITLIPTLELREMLKNSMRFHRVHVFVYKQLHFWIKNNQQFSVLLNAQPRVFKRDNSVGSYLLLTIWIAYKETFKVISTIP